MKKTKTLSIICVLLCSALLLTACKVGRTSEDNKTNGNSSSNAQISKNSDGSSDGSKSEDTDKSKSKDNNESITSSEGTLSADAKKNLEWPQEADAFLPKPNGQLTFKAKDNSTGAYSFTLSDMTMDDANKYISELEKMGYKDAVNVNDTNSITFSGNKDDGSTASFTYAIETKEGAIFYSPAQSDSN